MINVLDAFSLRGRTALVTGASRGIGAAIANALADAGARVLGVARSASPSLELERSIAYAAMDVSSFEEVRTRLPQLLGTIAPLNILVNGAGVSLTVEDDPDDLGRFQRSIEVNLAAAYAVSMVASPLMDANGRASIINVSSINSRLGFPGNPGYVASKGGLSALTRALAVDLGPRGIRVNSLSPGYFPTDMTAGSFADEAAHKRRAARTALGRWGRLEELRGPAIFLASDASSYVTGQEIIVDGGWTVRGL